MIGWKLKKTFYTLFLAYTTMHACISHIRYNISKITIYLYNLYLSPGKEAPSNLSLPNDW